MDDLQVDHRDEVIVRLKQAVEALIQFVPLTEETKPRLAYATECLSDKLADDAKQRWLKLKDAAKQVHYRQMLTTTSKRIGKIVRGTLLSAINAHGPITTDLIPSASKRISAQLAASTIYKVIDPPGGQNG